MGIIYGLTVFSFITLIIFSSLVLSPLFLMANPDRLNNCSLICNVPFFSSSFQGFSNVFDFQQLVYMLVDMYFCLFLGFFFGFITLGILQAL